MELLIGKYLDSEITPAEQRLLDQVLLRDAAARGLLRDMHFLHESARQAIQTTLGPENVAPPAVIFQRALDAHAARQRLLSLPRYLRVGATLAAGFLLGAAALVLLRQLNSAPAQQPIEVPTPVAAAPEAAPPLDHPDDTIAHRPLIRRLAPAPSDPWPDRPVEWYSLQDPQGSEWLIAAPRDDNVRSVSYYGD